MIVLITGATGLIGKALVQSLLDLDYKVNYLTMDANKVSGVFTDAIGYLWNPYEGEIDLKALDQVQVIIHLSGSNIAGPWSKRGKKRIMDSRVIPGEFLQKTLDRVPNKVRQVICASAIGIYPDTKDWQTEVTQIYGEDFLAEVVQKWEEQNWKFQKDNRIVTILRIGLFLDKKGGALPKMAQPIKMGAGAILGSGNQEYSWIHHQDLVRLFIFVLEHNCQGVYNAVSPNVVTNMQFTRTLAEVLKRPLLPFKIPAFAIKLLLKQKSILVLQGQKVSCQKVLESGFEFKYPDLKMALEQIYYK
ncbi:TIGR01777 family oxidoreductase [Myroides sp. LJL115]